MIATIKPAFYSIERVIEMWWPFWNDSHHGKMERSIGRRRNLDLLQRDVPCSLKTPTEEDLQQAFFEGLTGIHRAVEILFRER